MSTGSLLPLLGLDSWPTLQLTLLWPPGSALSHRPLGPWQTPSMWRMGAVPPNPRPSPTCPSLLSYSVQAQDDHASWHSLF